MNRTGEETIDMVKFKKQVFDYTESFKFNKVVSSFMILLNENKSKNLTDECKQELIEVLSIYMPNISSKMWGGKNN
jgi:leucyl-tRNA synthetase